MDEEKTSEGSSGRRQFIRTLATLGTAGVIATLLSGPVTEKPLIPLAQAQSGAPINIDETNSGVGTTELDSTISTAPVLKVVATATSSTGTGNVSGALYAETQVAGGTWPTGPFPHAIEGYASAQSGTNTGVWGHSDSPGGVGVSAFSDATTGGGKGVWGQSSSPDGFGVAGVNYCTATGTVEGNKGIYGESWGGIGVFGVSKSPMGASVFGLAGGPGTVAFVAQAASNQTASIQEWQDTNGKPLAVVDASGKVGIGTSAPQTTLQVAGGISVAMAVKTSNYTMASSDFAILANAASKALTITLPPASMAGMLVFIKKIDTSTHAVTIARAGTDTIEGATKVSLTGNNQSRTLIAGGSGVWYVISNVT
jgi:hypothetical protein